MGHHVVKILGAVAEIPGGGIGIEQEAPLLQVGSQTAPGRVLPPQLSDTGLALPPGALLDGRRRHLPHAQGLGLVSAAPQDEQQHPRHGNRQQQAHPHQLVGGAFASGIDPHGHNGAHQLQYAVDNAGVRVEEHGQQQSEGDLDQHHDHAHGNAGGRGDPPLRPLWDIRLSHRPAPPCSFIKPSPDRM